MWTCSRIFMLPTDSGFGTRAAELQKAYLLSQARAVVDITESIAKAPMKAGGTTEVEAQRAREEAVPGHLCGHVGAGKALARGAARWMAAGEGSAAS